MNEQTYIETVCNLRKRDNCRDKKQPCCKQGQSFRYTYCDDRGKLTLHCDDCSCGLSVEVDKRCPKKQNR